MIPALMGRNFFLLWTGQTVSQLGSQAFALAMMFWTMKATGSASLMGLLMTCSMLPGVLLGPFGGTFADRHSRVRIIVIGDLLAGSGVLATALALWLRPDDTRLILTLLFAVSVLLGVVRAFFQPAVAAAIPDLVEKEKLAAANSLSQFSVQASILAGQAVGGVLYTAIGAPLLFLVDALSYLFAGGCSALIPRDRPPVAERTGEAHPFRLFLRETAEGFRFVWGQKGLRDFMLTVSLVNFLAMPGTVLFPFYVELYLKAGLEWYGFLLAAVSAGAIAGFILSATLQLGGRRRAFAVLAAMVLYAVFFGSLAFIRLPFLALAAVFLGGLTVGVINVHLVTLTQTATPGEMRGRVMGLLGTLSGGLMPLGMVLGGIVGDLTGKNFPAIVLVSAGIALLVTISLGASRASREFLATG